MPEYEIIEVGSGFSLIVSMGDGHEIVAPITDAVAFSEDPLDVYEFVCLAAEWYAVGGGLA